MISSGLAMGLVRFIAALTLGGICFWTPTMAFEIVTRRELNLVIGTLVPPASGLFTYVLVARLNRRFFGNWTSIQMLAGIFVFGPVMMSTAAIPRGGVGLSNPSFVIKAALIPFVTLDMSGYDGTLFGVLLATVTMVVIHVRFERVLRTGGA
jgi:hypothetical protein